MKKLMRSSNSSTLHVFGLLLFLLPFGIPFFKIGGFSLFGDNNTPGQVAPQTPVPRISCIPRPWCFDHPPYCYKNQVMPSERWCPPNGCFYQQPAVCPQCIINGRPCPCNPILICPSGTPPPPITRPQKLSCSDCAVNNKNMLCFSQNEKIAFCQSSDLGILQQNGITCVSCAPSPSPTCIPRPPCLDNNTCPQTVPDVRICPPTITPIPLSLTPAQKDCTPQGSCSNGQQCPNGTVCSYLPVYQCYPIGCPYPICLASNTMIATPNGSVKVSDVKQGMLVWTVNKNGQQVASPVVKTVKTPVPSTHRIIHVVLADGRNVYASINHPTADGRTVDKLQPGDNLDGSLVVNVENQKYGDTYTYDLLPAGDTGYYYANGILLGSTLK